MSSLLRWLGICAEDIEHELAEAGEQLEEIVAGQVYVAVNGVQSEHHNSAEFRQIG